MPRLPILSAWYKFAGNANDSSGNALTLTGSSSPSLTTDRFGAANSAYSFSGNTSAPPYFFRLNTTTLNVTDNFTLMAWIYPTGYQGTNYFGLTNGIMAKGPATTYNWGLQVTSSTSISFVKRTGAESLQFKAFTGLSDLTNTWTHVAVVVANGYVSLYINGVYNQKLAVTNIAAGASDTIFVGAMSGGTGAAVTAFIGNLDDVRVYTSALTASDIYQVYSNAENTIPRTNATGRLGEYQTVILADSPNLYFRMNDTSGTTCVDLTGHANSTYASTGTGSYTLGVAGLTAQPGNTAVTFVGDTSGSNGAWASQATNVYNALSGNVSIEAWFKTSVSSSNGFQGIIAKSLSYGMYTYLGNFATYDNAAAAVRTTGIKINDGIAHHLVMTAQNGVAGGTNLYIDGKLVLTTTNGWSSTNQILYIARGQGGVPQSANGTVDEAAVYASILTPQQVYNHYLAGKVVYQRSNATSRTNVS